MWTTFLPLNVAVCCEHCNELEVELYLLPVSHLFHAHTIFDPEDGDETFLRNCVVHVRTTRRHNLGDGNFLNVYILFSMIN
jgi:hypothetical protein